MQQKRFHETSKVFGLIIYFPRPEPLGGKYEHYTTLIAAFMAEVDAIARQSLVLADASAPGTKWKEVEDRADQLTKLFPGINHSFDEVVAEIRTQIKEVEHESEQLK